MTIPLVQLLFFLSGVSSAAVNVDLIISLTVIIIAGLVLSSLFSGSEVAFFSLANSLDDQSTDQTDGNPGLVRSLEMLDRPRRLLATILIGNTFSNIVTAISAALLTGQIASAFMLPTFVIYGIEILVLTITIVILAEITPKILALKDPVKMSSRLSGFIYFWYIILAPVAILMSKSTKFLEDRFPKIAEKISSEDIKTIAEVGEMQGSLEGNEREIIENVIEFGNTMVREIMTSRVNIQAISTDDKLQNVLDMVRERSISRFPLYENDLDNIIGIIHSKDLLPYIDSNVADTANWKAIARKALFVPASKKIDDLLRDFQKEKTHIAIVVDEYGGTEGLVTMDDIMEEIIGEISDEFAEQVSLYTRRKNGDFIFDAKIDLDDMEEILDNDITTDLDEYETLGGLIYHIMERIPDLGEQVIFKDMQLTIHEIQNNRVSKVRVKKMEPPHQEVETEENN